MDQLSQSWYSYLSQTQPSETPLEPSASQIASYLTLPPEELQDLLTRKLAAFQAAHDAFAPVSAQNVTAFLESFGYDAAPFRAQILQILPDFARETLENFCLTVELLPFQATYFQLPGLNRAGFGVFHELIFSKLQRVAGALGADFAVEKRPDTKIRAPESRKLEKRSDFSGAKSTRSSDLRAQRARATPIARVEPQHQIALDLPTGNQVKSIQKFLLKQQKAREMKAEIAVKTENLGRSQAGMQNVKLNSNSIFHSQLMHLNYQKGRKRLLFDLKVEIFDGKFVPFQIYEGEDCSASVVRFCRVYSLNAGRGVVLKSIFEGVFDRFGVGWEADAEFPGRLHKSKM
eukprot:EST46468.1 Hypothetical protein SS50377_13550 [Spironucleus salmonicida]